MKPLLFTYHNYLLIYLLELKQVKNREKQGKT